MRRGPVATALLLGGAVGGLVLSSREWVTGTAQDPVLGPVEVSATGTQVAPVGSAVALLALAGVLVVLLNRGWSRRLALGVVGLAGAGLVWVALDVLADPAAAARGAGGASVPVGLGGDVAASATWAPWATLAAALCWLLGAALALVARPRPRRGSGGPATEPAEPPARPRRRPPGRGLSDAELERWRSARAWEDLSGGQDPTDDPPEELRPG